MFSFIPIKCCKCLNIPPPGCKGSNAAAIRVYRIDSRWYFPHRQARISWSFENNPKDMAKGRTIWLFQGICTQRNPRGAECGHCLSSIRSCDGYASSQMKVWLSSLRRFKELLVWAHLGVRPRLPCLPGTNLNALPVMKTLPSTI